MALLSSPAVNYFLASAIFEFQRTAVALVKRGNIFLNNGK